MTDAALIRRVLDGDAVAFTHLVDRYADRCMRYAYRMLGNREDAEEVVQETFLRAYRSLGRYHDRDRFDAWVFRILVNRCRTAAGRRGRHERIFVADDVALSRASQQAATRHEDTEIQRAVEALPPLLREAFLLRHVEELDYHAMVAVTGAGLSALRMRVKRACDLLRESLKEWDHE
jgi:RNA polymerase sigma-70 factor (ECF subfamily)